MSAGLFDFQVNGFAGVDFQADDLDGAAMLAAVSGLRRHRTEAILLTLVTDTVEALCRRLERIERLRAGNPEIASMVRGYHLEGPWISREPGFYGAHPLEWVAKPTLPDYRRLRDAAGGKLRLITLAPEVEGALEVIEAARRDGIRIGLGHTNAPEAAIDQAIQAGASLATHLGNAVPVMLARHDNVVQRLLARDELIACLIPDGIHLPPFVLRNFFRAKPQGQVFFTTDCMAAAGAPPGKYSFGPYELEVGADGIAHLPGDERFAGSSLTLDQGVRNVVSWLGLSETEAWGICSKEAARHFGIEFLNTADTL